MKIVPVPCPDCGGRLELSLRLVAKNVGDFSLAGAFIKFPVRTLPELDCLDCAYSRLGEIQDGQAVFR